MKVITYLNAPIQKLWNVDELLPSKKASFLPYVETISKRYNFAEHGQSSASANANVFTPVFQGGSFEIDGDKIPVITLDFAINRVLAACSTTEQTKAFYEDFTKFLTTELQFREPKSVMPDLVSSSLVVDLGPSFLQRVSFLATIENSIQSKLSTPDIDAQISPTAIRLNGNYTRKGVPSKYAISYNLEERANRPPGTHWLFSQAPMGTKEHEALLEEIEQLASS